MRVIAGALKGRRLRTPTWTGLRPTSDKLRETLFNILSDRIVGATLLDAYAGTGAIGIEALSRGAAHVTFIDSDARAAKLIRQNLELCGVSDRYAIIRRRLETPPSIAPDSLDLAVLDPPYEESDFAAAIGAAEPLLAPGGLLVLEHASRRPAPVSVKRLSRVRTVKSGDSALAFYSRQA